MEFLKKNYEKVLLGVVLLGLTAAACSLPFVISSKRTKLDDERVAIRTKAKDLPPVNMATEDEALQLAQAPVNLDFTAKHNLFNPVVWKKLPPEGHLLKMANGNEEGPAALEVTAIRELYLIVSYGSPSASGYFINIDRQNNVREDRRHTQNFVSKDNKGELLALQDIKGPPDHPTELDLIWNETGETMVITPEKPFKRVEGYAADLKYPLEPNKIWTDRRVGSKPLFFAGGYYNIVAIDESNVVVSAESNKKKTTIKFHPSTEPR